MDHRHRLQNLILAAQKYQWDLQQLTELRHAPDAAEELQMVFIEEFLFLQYGRVGFLLPFHMRELWLSQGARWYASCPHLSSLFFTIFDQPYAITSVYIPSGHTALQRTHRAEVYQQALDHYRRNSHLHPGILQLWGGDWNAHVGRDHQLQSDKLTGALETKTAQSGLEQRRWLSQTAMQCIDHFFKIGHRGTWKHPGNKAWYELDFFCGDDRLLRQAQTIRALTLGISDHRAKQLILHLPNPHSKQAWRRGQGPSHQSSRPAISTSYPI